MNVIIVGGGFAGVKAALELSKRGARKITLISDEAYFLHHATLYATATGKNTAESVIGLQDMFADHPQVTIVKDRIVSVDPHRNLVTSKSKSYRYDKLILALGSVTTYFGVEGLEQHAYGIKSLAEIKKFKEHIHTEVVKKKLDKEYFVIGAGSTGVELAGALQEYISYLKSTYRLKSTRTRVTIVEAAPRILPNASATAASVVMRRLRKMDIKVLVDHKVQSLSDNMIRVEGKKIPTTTAVWTAGVKNNPFFEANKDAFNLTPNGRVVVNPYLQAFSDVYVVGDNSAVKHGGAAWSAMRQATYAARHIMRAHSSRPHFGFHSHASMFGLPVGDRWGYVEWMGVYVSGRVGYVARRLMELYGYTRLLPFHKAVIVWRAHDLPQVDE